MISGTLTVIVYKNLQGGIFDLFEIVPGFLLSWAAIVLFSKLYPNKEQEKIEKEFAAVQRRARR